MIKVNKLVSIVVENFYPVNEDVQAVQGVGSSSLVMAESQNYIDPKAGPGLSVSCFITTNEQVDKLIEALTKYKESK